MMLDELVISRHEADWNLGGVFVSGKTDDNFIIRVYCCPRHVGGGLKGMFHERRYRLGGIEERKRLSASGQTQPVERKILFCVARADGCVSHWFIPPG